MKRMVVALLVGMLLFGMVGSAFAVAIDPQQMGHVAYLEAEYGAQEATRILDSYGRSSVPTRIIYPSQGIFYYPNNPWGYIMLPTIYGGPTAIPVPPKLTVPVSITGYDPFYPTKLFSVQDATSFVSNYVRDRWDASIYGDFVSAYESRYDTTPVQAVRAGATDGYISYAALQDILNRVDGLITHR